MVRKARFKYFVSYHFITDGGAGFGHMDVPRSEPLTCIQDVQKMTVDMMSKIDAPVKALVVLNWRRYEVGLTDEDG
jgi:hypothetical protein